MIIDMDFVAVEADNCLGSAPALAPGTPDTQWPNGAKNGRRRGEEGVKHAARGFVWAFAGQSCCQKESSLHLSVLQPLRLKAAWARGGALACAVLTRISVQTVISFLGGGSDQDELV